MSDEEIIAAIRQVGGIVHSDGNIFLKNVMKFRLAVSRLPIERLATDDGLLKALFCDFATMSSSELMESAMFYARAHVRQMSTIFDLTDSCRSLQKALSYWMPSIADPSGTVDEERCARDAMLLAGLDEDEEGGWGNRMLALLAQTHAPAVEPPVQGASVEASDEGVPALTADDIHGVCRACLGRPATADEKVLADAVETELMSRWASHIDELTREGQELMFRSYDLEAERRAWQPMESAPMDGTPILLFARHYEAISYVIVVGDYIERNGGWTAAVFSPNKRQRIVPRYWRRLPEFPPAERNIEEAQ